MCFALSLWILHLLCTDMKVCVCNLRKICEEENRNVTRSTLRPVWSVMSRERWGRGCRSECEGVCMECVLHVEEIPAFFMRMNNCSEIKIYIIHGSSSSHPNQGFFVIAAMFVTPTKMNTKYFFWTRIMQVKLVAWNLEKNWVLSSSTFAFYENTPEKTTRLREWMQRQEQTKRMIFFERKKSSRIWILKSVKDSPVSSS